MRDSIVGNLIFQSACQIGSEYLSSKYLLCTSGFLSRVVKLRKYTKPDIHDIHGSSHLKGRFALFKKENYNNNKLYNTELRRIIDLRALLF